MKVAIISYGHIDSILPLVKHLSDKIQVDLYVSVYGQRYTESIGSFDLSGYENGLHDVKTTLGLFGKKISDYVDNKFGLYLLKYPDLKVKNTENVKISYKFAKYLDQNNYSIVHYNGNGFSQFVITAFLRRKRVLWTIHDPFLHSGEERASTNILYKTIGFFDRNVVLYNSHWMRDFIRTYSFNPKNVHYVRHGCMEVYRSYAQTINNKIRKGKNILFFGRISRYKGIEYLVQAVLKIKDEMPDINVVIAGDGKYYFDTSQIENSPNFEIINRYVGNEELVQLIQKSDVVVCPYTDATQSGVVLTAYALNKPVIATSVGGIPEVVIPEVTGKLVPPKDADALSQAILDVFSDPIKLDRMSDNIQDYFNSGEYSWDSISDKMIHVYNKVLS